MAFEKIDAELLYPLALTDSARNYFICYTINNGQAYENAWAFRNGESPVVGVFLRKTGILQLAVTPGFELASIGSDLKGLLSGIPWKQANVSTEHAKVLKQIFPDFTEKKGAWISRCLPEDFVSANRNVKVTLKPLFEGNLDEIVALYQTVFKGFASRAYMSEKLKSGRGRAVGAYVGETLVAVAQSDYECKESAIIVGVATSPTYQGKGYGRACFEALSAELVNEGKTLYLQYDSEIAGALYKSAGFHIIDNIITIENQSLTI